MYPEPKFPSPNGKYVFRIYAWEVRMSQWIETPDLFDLSTQQSLLRFTDTTWSLDSATWLNDHEVTIWVRKYPGDHVPSSFAVCIDCAKHTASVMAGPPIPLSSLEQTLERCCSGLSQEAGLGQQEKSKG